MNRVSKRCVLEPSRHGTTHAWPGSALIALCLVLLQLVLALHFALVPHGFSAGLSGFVHIHGERSTQAQRSGLARRASSAPALLPSSAACVAESCPIGFAGQHSVLLASHGPAELLAAVTTPELARSRCVVVARKRALLSAPKTSPPV